MCIKVRRLNEEDPHKLAPSFMKVILLATTLSPTVSNVDTFDEPMPSWTKPLQTYSIAITRPHQKDISCFHV